MDAVSAAVCFPLGTSSTISAWRGTFAVSMAGRQLGLLWALLRLCKREATEVQLWAGAPEGLAWSLTSPASTRDTGVGLSTSAGGMAGTGTRG